MRNLLLISCVFLGCLNSYAQDSPLKAKVVPKVTANIFRKSDGLVASLNNRTVSQSLSTLRTSKLSLRDAPEVVNLIGKGIAGTFILDPTDNYTADNTGRVLVTASGLRYKRVIHGGLLQLDWYLAKGDKKSDDTDAVQNAIDDAVSAANALNGELPTYGKSGTLLVPVGSYRIKSVKISGSIRLIGQGGGTYAGSTFVQAKEGVSMIVLAPDKNGTSNSTVIENICFKSGSSSSNPTVAQIKTIAGIESNSIYIRNCWFKTPENYGIWLTQGDDIQISGCTFDICPFNAIRLGTQGTGLVTNCSLSNNTFFRVSLAHIKLDNVIGVTISHNRAYNSDKTQISTATFVDGISATNINGLTILGNEYNNLPNFAKIPTNARGVVISSNTGYQSAGYFLSLTGGGVLYNISVIGNTVFSQNAWKDAPIVGVDCGLQGAIILGNSFMSGNSSALGINLSDKRVYNNIVDKNLFTNFQKVDNLFNPTANGQNIPTLMTQGDLLYYDGSKLSRIPRGANGQVLKIVSGKPMWSN